MKLYPERANKAYDRMKEPWRFIVAMFVIGPVFFVSTVPVLVSCGIMVYATFIGVLRLAYLCKLEFIPGPPKR